MSTSAIENPLPVNAAGESKSARKKKGKAANGTPAPATAVPEAPATDLSSQDAGAEANGTAYEHPHLKELQKQIRSLNKKLGGMLKTDAVIAENPGVSLDELVSQRKLNNDQRASAEKKPGMQAQLQHLEEQVQVFKAVNADYQAQMQKQKDEAALHHQKELEKLKEDTRLDGLSSSASELRKKLLVLSQFLRAAAAKRNIEEDAGSDENMAFEGALLLIYGGDEKAVDTAVSLIDGSDEQVPSIDGVPLSIKYSQIKQASIDHAPFQNEEAWVDQVEEANASTGEHINGDAATGSDPTLVNAGLTELDGSANTNGSLPQGAQASATSIGQTQASTGDEGGNRAGDHWDTGAGAEKNGMEDSYEIVPRPNEEVDTPAPPYTATEDKENKPPGAVDEAPPSDQPSGNQAGEAWDMKPAGDQGTDNSWAAEVTAAAENGEGPVAGGAPPTATPDDGFQAVGGRRGRGGPRGGRGDGEFRGRGGRGGGRGGFRGDGEFRGRGGGRGGRGGRGDGEFRGRGGGGRGGRGRGDGQGAPRGAPAAAPMVG